MDQRGVTKSDLRPYLRMVEGRIASNAENPVWAKMDARWSTLVSHARDRLAAYEAGTATSAPLRIASQELTRIAELVEARQVVVTVAAIFMMQVDDPYAFRSDAAFTMQLVRRVRALGDRGAAQYVDARSGKTRRMYRELSPRAALVMGQWVAEALGALGLRLAALERHEAAERDQERRELSDALMALK